MAPKNGDQRPTAQSCDRKKEFCLSTASVTPLGRSMMLRNHSLHRGFLYAQYYFPAMAQVPKIS